MQCTAVGEIHDTTRGKQEPKIGFDGTLVATNYVPGAFFLYIPGGDPMLSKNNASTETIAAAFGAITEKDPPPSLTKHYKGLTLREYFRIVEVKPECAKIKANKREIFPCLEGEIYLHSEVFPQSIAGRIHPVDYTKGIFLLSDLSYAEWKDRSSDRVQPKDSVYLKLYHNRQIYRAFLDDISVLGLGIMGNKSIDPFNQLKPGEKVELEFDLTEEYTFSNLAGVLVYRQKIGLHLVKFGLKLSPNQFQKRSIEKYIHQRKEEILEEINQKYLRSREPQGVENLYF
jgi:hypothetical protein